MDQVLKTGLLAIGIFALAVACVHCSQPKRQVPPIYYGLDESEKRSLALNTAAQFEKNNYFKVAATGSMEPVLTAGDWVAVEGIPYDEVEEGMMAVYQARWLDKDARPVCHWVSAKQGKEWIMDGEHNRFYEKDKTQLMGEKEFYGKVVGIFTSRTK